MGLQSNWKKGPKVLLTKSNDPECFMVWNQQVQTNCSISDGLWLPLRNETHLEKILFFRWYPDQGGWMWNMLQVIWNQNKLKSTCDWNLRNSNLQISFFFLHLIYNLQIQHLIIFHLFVLFIPHWPGMMFTSSAHPTNIQKVMVTRVPLYALFCELSALIQGLFVAI